MINYENVFYFFLCCDHKKSVPSTRRHLYVAYTQNSLKKKVWMKKTAVIMSHEELYHSSCMVLFAGSFLSKTDKLIIFHHKATIYNRIQSKKKVEKTTLNSIFMYRELDHVSLYKIWNVWSSLRVAALSNEVNSLKTAAVKSVSTCMRFQMRNSNEKHHDEPRKRRFFFSCENLNWLQQCIRSFHYAFVSFVSTLRLYVMLQSTQWHGWKWRNSKSYGCKSCETLYLHDIMWCSSNERINSAARWRVKEMNTNIFSNISTELHLCNTQFLCHLFRYDQFFEGELSKCINICLLSLVNEMPLFKVEFSSLLFSKTLTFDINFVKGKKELLAKCNLRRKLKQLFQNKREYSNFLFIAISNSQSDPFLSFELSQKVIFA